MKKICFITTIPLTLRSFVLPTAERLHKSCGYDITFISSYDENFEKNLPEYIHYIPVDMRRGIDFSGFKLISEFRKIFKKEEFDMVQYSTPNAAFYASIAAKQAKIPIRLYAEWGFRYVGAKGISRKILKLIEKISCKKSTHVRTVSPLNLEYGISEGLYKREKIKVLGRGGTIGVDLSQYDLERKKEWRNSIREKFNINEDDFVYGFVGRVSIDKGIKELLTAIKNVLNVSSKVKLMIVGSIDAENSNLLELLEWAKSCKNIIITGKIDGLEMKKYYSALDVLVHPTYREGFGMVIQEAGALAIPTITTKIPGASEVMVENESCLLVEPRNVDELEKAMLYLIDNHEKVVELGENAYKMVCEYYERNKMLDNLQADYEELLK